MGRDGSISNDSSNYFNITIIVIVVIDFLFPADQMEVNLQVAGNTWATACFNILNPNKQVFRSDLQNVDVSRHGLRRRHLHRSMFFFFHYSFRLYILLNCQLWHLKRTRRRRRRCHIDCSISQIDFPVCAFTHSAPKHWWRARWRLCEVLFFGFFFFLKEKAGLLVLISVGSREKATVKRRRERGDVGGEQNVAAEDKVSCAANVPLSAEW